MACRCKRVLAIASGGGHWVQLLRLRPAFIGDEVTWVTIHPDRRDDIGFDAFYTVPDATRWSKIRLIRMTLQLLVIFLRVRPHAVVTTGAAPGLAAMMIGRFFGCKTIWLDSIANADELSLAGQRAGAHADLWLTQWEHLARDGGPMYSGAVV